MIDKNAIIKQLQDAIDQLKRENESLKGHIRELEAKLAMHDNAHTQPRLKRGGKRKKDQDAGDGKVGAEEGA
jgi:cell division septum initiation protein DivIVA